MKVIDVSHHNGVIDWRKVKDDGIEGVIIRAGFGTTYTDNRFIENITGAIKVGLKIGIYWFMYGCSKDAALKNAQKCVSLIEPYKSKIILGVSADWEYDSDNKCTSSLTKSSRTEIVKTFCDYINEKGYTACIYTNQDYYNNKFDMNVLKKYPLWMASYRSDKPNYNLFMWQYSSTGRVNGISGNVDLNNLYKLPGEIQTTPESTPSIIIKLNILKKGSKGKEVFTVQSILKSLGYKGNNEKELSLDSNFGENTEYAVKSYQRDKNLRIDGIVGTATWSSLLK